MRGGCDELNTNSRSIFYHNDNHIFAESREYRYCLSLVFNIVLICLFGMGEKMTKSFDEWYREAKKLNNDGFSAKDFFEAGQKTKQAEVDELKRELRFKDASIKNLKLQFENKQIDCDISDRKVDELQKRIDVLSKKLNEMAHIFLDDLDEIRKGNTNEH